jgi:glycosyltransferase involved in cell wall biosynthesis
MGDRDEADVTTTERHPLRVAMTTASYLPEGGGTAIHTHEMARRLVAAGVDVTILTTAFRRADTGPTVVDGLKVTRVRAWPRGTDYYFAPGLGRLLRREDFDLVHCQGYHTLVAPITMLGALMHHVPCVLSFHSGGHSSPLRRAIRPAQTRLLRPLMRRSAALLAVSEFEADLFAKRLDLPRSAITVIPSGVELPPPQSDVPVAPEPLIVSVGRLESYKGHLRVIEALPSVQAVRPDMRVRVVGTGPSEPELRRLAKRLGVGDSVDIGPVAADRRHELADLLRRAAVVAALSEYESQGLAANEALALGRPLVVNDSSALRELAGRPNVRMVASSASAGEVAEAMLELAAAPNEPPGPYPTWPDSVAAVLDVYESIMSA